MHVFTTWTQQSRKVKGFAYAEFKTLDSLLSALNLNEKSLGSRIIQLGIADQAQNKDGSSFCLLAEVEIRVLRKQTDDSILPQEVFNEYLPISGDNSQWN